MAFVQNQLVPIGGQSRKRKGSGSGAASVGLWSYFHATDALAAVKATGYFNSVRDMLAPGDVILFSANGAAIDIITILASPTGPAAADVTVQTADINSA